jgi:hypothetical protein
MTTHIPDSAVKATITASRTVKATITASRTVKVAFTAIGAEAAQ